MDVPKIKECLKELENAGNADRILEVLQRLQSDFKPTEQLLRETKIGVAVNRLRSHQDARVSSLVKKLVGNWRDQVQQQKARNQKAKRDAAASGGASGGATSTGGGASSSTSTGGASGSGSGSAAASSSSNGANGSGTASTSTTSAAGGSGSSSSTSGAPGGATGGPAKKRDAKSDGVNTQIYNDSVRNSCVQVTYNALVTESTFPSDKILAAAKDVEQAVFHAERGTTPAYRNKMRSLFMNLKDPKNPTLRTQVVLGKISGERLRTMKPQEMANEELKKQMEEIEKQNLFNAQSAQEQRSTTDRFTCGKCKQKKVSYYQMQTRSADEPLTTFCTCENCGNRWKFS